MVEQYCFCQRGADVALTADGGARIVLCVQPSSAVKEVRQMCRDHKN